MSRKMERKKIMMRKRMSGKNNPMYGKSGALAPNWKGERAKPTTIHIWLHRNKKMPDICERCHQKQAQVWANIKNHNYTRNPDDYIGICVSCHREMDGLNEKLKGMKFKVTEEDRKRRSDQMKEFNKTTKGRKLNLTDEERQRRGRQILINRGL